MNNFTIVGLGYVGLTIAISLAQNSNNNIICLDIDNKKINKLKRGTIPLYDKTLEKININSFSNLKYTNKYNKAFKNTNVVFLCVPTPKSSNGSADLTYVWNVCQSIIKNIYNDILLIIKSTVPIGVSDEIQNYFDQNSSYKVNVAFIPEFLSQGSCLDNYNNPDRIIIGCQNKKIFNIIKNIYKKNFIIAKTPIMFTSRKSAEMIKYASNSFLATKISFINEMSTLCEKMDINIEEVTKGMGYDKRIGKNYLKPGIGFGGSCLPKDLESIKFIANQMNVELKIIDSVLKVNEIQSQKLVDLFLCNHSNIQNMKIAILGVTYKANTDDIRCSPALINIDILLQKKANLFIYDPYGLNKLKEIYKDKVKYCTSIDEALKSADVAFIFTDWQDIKKYPIQKYRLLMKEPLIYDGRNCYDINKVKKEQIEYISIGRCKGE